MGSWFNGPAAFGPVLRLRIVIKCEVKEAAYLLSSLEWKRTIAKARFLWPSSKSWPTDLRIPIKLHSLIVPLPDTSWNQGKGQLVNTWNLGRYPRSFKVQNYKVPPLSSSQDSATTLAPILHYYHPNEVGIMIWGKGKISHAPVPAWHPLHLLDFLSISNFQTPLKIVLTCKQL